MKVMVAVLVIIGYAIYVIARFIERKGVNSPTVNEIEPNLKICSEESLNDLIDGYSRSRALLLFPTLKPGDVVVCVMPFSEKCLRKINTSHRVRPYIVLEVKKDYFTAYQSTSRAPGNNSRRAFEMTAGRYNVWKDGWIMTDDIYCVPEENVLRVLDHLTIADQREINNIVSESSRGIKKYFPIPKDCFVVRKGCVLEKENAFYYFWNDDFKPLLIKMEESGEIAIDYKSKAFYLTPSEAIEVETLSEYAPAGYPIGDVQSKLNDMYIIQNTTCGLLVTPRKSLTPKESVKADTFIFECPIGTVLTFCDRKYLYLYSAKDNQGLLKQYGISGDEVMNEQPIVDEIAYYDLYKPIDRVEEPELEEILSDAATRKRRHYLLNLMEFY